MKSIVSQMNSISFHRFFQLLKRFLIALLILIGLYFLSALLLSMLKTHPQKMNCAKNREIFVTTNGVHLDIILRFEDIDPELLQKLEILPGTKYIAFGWGDKQFYINTPEWKDLTFKTAFKALFLKSETAMHVTCYFNKHSSWRTIQICESQLEILTSYVSDSFQKTEKGLFKKIDVPGYYETDFFYHAKGSFSLFKTCNVWVNQALKQAGVPTSIWSPFDFGILYHLPD